jgi:hypothetical protein
VPESEAAVVLRLELIRIAEAAEADHPGVFALFLYALAQLLRSEH